MIQENFSPSKSFSQDIFLITFSVLNEEPQNSNLQSKAFRSSASYSIYNTFNGNRVSNTVSGFNLWVDLIILTVPWGDYHAHFINEKTEVLRSKSNLLKVAELFTDTAHLQQLCGIACTWKTAPPTSVDWLPRAASSSSFSSAQDTPGNLLIPHLPP